MTEDQPSQSQGAAAAVTQPVYIPGNFPLPAPLEYKGDVYSNWKFFRLQWEDYEVATQLNTKSEGIGYILRRKYKTIQPQRSKLNIRPKISQQKSEEAPETKRHLMCTRLVLAN